MVIQNHFYLIRHGESENNVLEIESSKIENKGQFGLTEKGKRIISKEASKYNSFDRIFSSPFRRATETAKIFSECVNCPVVEDNRLREVDAGIYELKDYEELHLFYKKNGLDTPVPNGESLNQARDRAINFIEDINNMLKDEKILIVTHGHIIKAICAYLVPDFDWKEYQIGRAHV